MTTIDCSKQFMLWDGYNWYYANRPAVEEALVLFHRNPWLEGELEIRERVINVTTGNVEELIRFKNYV